METCRGMGALAPSPRSRAAWRSMLPGRWLPAGRSIMQRLRVGWWLSAGLAGGLVFWLFQVLTGPATITQFMGEQIVAEGGYPPALTIPIGWAVHLGVSLGYALLFAVIMLIPFSPSPGARLAIGAVIGAALGWIGTLLTVPAHGDHQHAHPPGVSRAAPRAEHHLRVGVLEPPALFRGGLGGLPAPPTSAQEGLSGPPPPLAPARPCGRQMRPGRPPGERAA